MRIKLSLPCVSVLAALLVTVGCSSAERIPALPDVFVATGTAFLEEVDRDASRPPSGWRQVVETTGEGLPAANAVSEVEKKLTAIEAAKYRAMANLAQKAHGIRVLHSAKVRDMMFAGEEVTAEAEGELVAVKVVRSEYDPETETAKVTVRMGFDPDTPIDLGDILPLVPPSTPARRVRAEAAARINALAALLEQVGEVRVGQYVRVKNLMLANQEAWLVVEGVLAGVRFSEPEWVTDNKCTVQATLKVPRGEFERLREMIPRGMP